MDHSKLHFDRREFFLALGAVPLLTQGCGDVESIEFRGNQFRGKKPEPDVQLAELVAAVQIKRTLSSQSFSADEQGCSVAQSLAVAVGDQVRVTRNSQEYALYTVEQKRSQDKPDRVRMGLDARLRLGTSREFPATLSIPVVAQGLTDAQAEAASEFVERLVDDGSNTGLVVIAPHGGTIETRTDRQAELVTAALGCSSWICKGWKAGGGSYERWHITSTKLSRNSFPGLDAIADRGFVYCVSFHGMSSGGVLIGGAAPLELRQLVQEAILAELSDPTIAVDLATEDDEFNGDSPSNVVNWLTADGFGGVQVEQGRAVRIEHWQEIAAGVINAYAQLI